MGNRMKRNRMGLMRVGEDGSTYFSTPNGVRYRLGKGEPIGRIHSINIGLPAPSIKISKRTHTTSHTVMRCRVRNTRPARCWARRRGTGSRVSSSGSGLGNNSSLSLSEDFVAKLVIHIVRPHLDDDLTYGDKQQQQQQQQQQKNKKRLVSEEYAQEDVFADQESEPQYLRPTRKIRPPSQNEQPKAKLTEFEEIMRRRKNKVDTMDNTGRLMKSLSSQSDAHLKRSALWRIVRDCLKDKSYLNFASKRMGSFSHTP